MKNDKRKKCKCGMHMANYPWTEMCRVCWGKEQKKQLTRQRKF